MHPHNRVVAKYLGTAEDDFSNLPSVEHAQELARKGTDSSPTRPSADTGTSLLDGVIDTSTLLKNQGPNVQDLDPVDIPFAAYNDAHVYSGSDMDKGVRQEWAESKQNLERSSGPLRSDYYGDDVIWANDRFASFSLAKVIESANHRKKTTVLENANAVSVSRVSSSLDEEQGLFLFKCNSTGSDTTHSVAVQFMADDKASTLVDHPVKVGCTCDFFLYWGPQFYAVINDYMHMDFFRPSLVRPKAYIIGQTNPGRGVGQTFCKHIAATFKSLKELHKDIEPGEEGDIPSVIGLDKLQRRLIRVENKDILSESWSSQDWADKYSIYNKDSLLGFLKRWKKTVPKTLINAVRVQASAAGMRLTDVDTFIDTEWEKWTLRNDDGLVAKRRFLEKAVLSPDLLLYVLLRDTQESGSVDMRVFKFLYLAIDTTIKFDELNQKEIMEYDDAEV